MMSYITICDGMAINLCLDVVWETESMYELVPGNAIEKSNFLRKIIGKSVR